MFWTYISVCLCSYYTQFIQKKCILTDCNFDFYIIISNDRQLEM
jgi:hypothetical protein